MGSGRDRVNRFLDKWLNFGQFPGSELGGLDTGFRHKTYYHKHFQGFTEIRRVGKNGRITIERCYTAPWQRHRLTNRQWVLTKAAYVLGVLLSSILYLWAAARRIASNSAPLVAAPTVLAGLMLLLMWMSVCAYVTAPRSMTLWEYRSGKGKVELFSRLAAAALLLTAAAKAVFVCVFLHFSWAGEAGSMAALIVAAIPLVLIFLIERRMPYQEQENTANIVEEERYEIQ